MAERTPLVICLLLVSSVALICLVNKAVTTTDFIKDAPAEYSWVGRGAINILSYMTVLLPGFLIYKYIHKVNYLGLSGDTFCDRAVRLCFAENEFAASFHHNAAVNQRTIYQELFLISFHFFGLLVSYLTWGVLQEKVMTQKYINPGGESAQFTDSQFLVFVNRVLAFSMSGLYMLYQSYTQFHCPLYKYTFCSLSNILSSWCQYEALKYVSFPHQVLAKAAKPIPVMIMGKVVSQTKYEYYEYVTSGILSVGMLLFLLDAENDKAVSGATTASGALLLLFYIASDSFTSNWQGSIFKTYRVKPIQMMCFVNLFSCVFTAVSLLQQDAFYASVSFMFKYPRFFADCIVLSVCSATGQLFIFSTISKFGPLVFAIITTIRQGFSVLLSCVIYDHHVGATGIGGVALVFLSVFLRIYCGHRVKSAKGTGGAKGHRILV